VAIKTIETEQFPILSYSIAGTGPAVVLIHGFPENGGLWREVWPTLADNFTVIVPDLPGAGGSKLPSTPLTIEDLAHAVKLVCENENVERVIVVGHSMGGYTALAFAEKYPSSVKGLSLVHSTATADTDEKKETRRKAIGVIEKGGKDVFVRQMIPGLFSERYKKEHPEMIKEQTERGLQIAAESLIAFYNAMIIRPDRTDTLRNAAFPVQWIIGKEDTVAPMSVVMQQTQLANVNFVSVYEESAHMSMLEEPIHLVKDLADFASYCKAK
jgi:pimeloyl-ACP methyl ester carboxylesterase